MKCPPGTAIDWDLTERKSDNYTFNTCLYICGKYKESVAFVSTKVLWF